MDNKRPIDEGNEATDEVASSDDKQEIQASLGSVFYQIVRLQNLLRANPVPTAAGESSKQG